MFCVCVFNFLVLSLQSCENGVGHLSAMLHVRQPHTTPHKTNDTEGGGQGQDEDDTLQLFHKGKGYYSFVRLLMGDTEGKLTTDHYLRMCLLVSQRVIYYVSSCLVMHQDRSRFGYSSNQFRNVAQLFERQLQGGPLTTLKNHTFWLSTNNRLCSPLYDIIR